MTTLPLLSLFERLHENGLPLGIDEYGLLVEALQAGFGLPDKEALFRLCRTLWVKSTEDLQLLNYHFGLLIAEWAEEERHALQLLQRDQPDADRIASFPAFPSQPFMPAPMEQGDERRASALTEQPVQLLAGINPAGSGAADLVEGQSEALGPSFDRAANVAQRSEDDAGAGAKEASKAAPYNTVADEEGLHTGGDQQSSGPMQGRSRPTTPTRVSTQPSTAATGATSSTDLTLEVDDEIQVAKALLQNANESEVLKPFIFSGEYFPVTMRQMKRSWRYLRRAVREGAPTEFSLTATITKASKDGELTDFVFIPPRVNRSELLLLIDQDGSMLPFHILSRRLIETASRGGQLRSVDTFYFHNCPQEYLYGDVFQQKPKLLREVLGQVRSGRAGILIFSDAGAARGRRNGERFRDTRHFLSLARQSVSHIVWLNPMPKERWLNTTAEKISSLVPMFELSRQGLDMAIRVLLGKSAQG